MEEFTYFLFNFWQQIKICLILERWLNKISQWKTSVWALGNCVVHFLFFGWLIMKIASASRFCQVSHTTKALIHGEFKSASCIVDIPVYFAIKKKLRRHWALCLWLLLPRLLLSAHKGKLNFSIFYFFQPLVSDQAPFIFGPFGDVNALWQTVFAWTYTHIHSGKKGHGSGQSRTTPLHRRLIGGIHTSCPWNNPRLVFQRVMNIVQRWSSAVCVWVPRHSAVSSCCEAFEQLIDFESILESSKIWMQNLPLCRWFCNQLIGAALAFI